MGKESAVIEVSSYGSIDAATLNYAIEDMSNKGGGVLHLPAGTYYLNTAIILRSNVILQGDGFGRTILCAANGTSHHVMETHCFSCYVGTNATTGPRGFGLRDLTIDGNRWNRTGSGICLAIYGYDYELTNVEIIDSCGIGFYSEWAISGNVPVTLNGRDTMEAHITGLRVFRCASDGISFNGPHDTIMRDVLTYVNGRYGVIFSEMANTYTAGGTMVDQLHSYANAEWGIVVNSMLFCGLLESESNSSGGGVLVGGEGGEIRGGSVLSWGNTGVGVEFTRGGSVTTVVANNNSSDGVRVFSSKNQLNVSSYTNQGDGIVFWSSDDNTISPCRSYNNTGKGVYLQGNNNALAGAMVEGNGAGGITIQTGASGSRVNGIVKDNTGTQADFGTLASPSLVDLLIRTATGQTAWSGSYTAGEVRLVTGSI